MKAVAFPSFASHLAQLAESDCVLTHEVGVHVRA